MEGYGAVFPLRFGQVQNCPNRFGYVQICLKELPKLAQICKQLAQKNCLSLPKLAKNLLTRRQNFVQSLHKFVQL